MIRIHSENTYDGIRIRITRYLPPEDPEIIIKCYDPSDYERGLICHLKGDEVPNGLVREKVDQMVNMVRKGRK